MNSQLRHRRWTDKSAYAIERMCTAVERLIDRGITTPSAQDAAWSVAWAIAAGATPPGHFVLRPGHDTPYDMQMVRVNRRRAKSML